MVLGALLAPPLFWLGQHLGQTYETYWPSLSRFGLQKYLNRAVLLVALLGLWPLGRMLGVRGLRDLGWRPTPKAWRTAGHALLVGGCVVALAGVLRVWFGAAEAHWRLTLPKATAALVAALVVAVLEETLFRGLILGALAHRRSAALAIGATSIVFATVHFVAPGPATADAVRWSSGFELVAASFHQFLDVSLWLRKWLNLFVAGVGLGWLTLRSGSLHVAFGLHAGWVLGVKLVQLTTRFGADGWWFTRDPAAGLAALGAVALSLCLAGGLIRNPDA